MTYYLIFCKHVNELIVDILINRCDNTNFCGSLLLHYDDYNAFTKYATKSSDINKKSIKILLQLETNYLNIGYALIDRLNIYKYIDIDILNMFIDAYIEKYNPNYPNIYNDHNYLIYELATYITEYNTHEYNILFRKLIDGCYHDYDLYYYITFYWPQHHLVLKRCFYYSY